MQAATAGSSRRVAALPLAVTVAVHLLLVWWWLGHPAPRHRDDARRVASVFVRVPPLPMLRPRPQPEAPAVPRPRRHGAGPATAAPSAPAAPPAAAPPAPAEAPVAPALPADPAGSAPSGLLDRAKREAGPIDRALRGRKSGVPRQADTPWARFQRGVDAGYADRSLSLTMDSYTSPDGVVIYRFKQRGKVRCRATGSVSFLPGGIGGAGDVPCPADDAGWVRR